MKSLIVVLSLLIAGAANAQSCETPESVKAQVLAVVPSAYVAATHDGDEAQVILKGYNEAPPPSDWKADSITVMRAPGFAYALLIAHEGGCVVFKDQVPLAAYLHWLGRGA